MAIGGGGCGHGVGCECQMRCQAIVAQTGDLNVDICNSLLAAGSGKCMADEKHTHPSPAAKIPIGTIDLTPSWEAVVGVYLEMLTRPEFDGAKNYHKRQSMHSEILRAAKLADLYVKEHTR